MFGFGGKKFRVSVYQLLDQIGARGLIPAFAPINSEIMKARLLKFNEYEATLLLCYSSALSVDAAGERERAQALYDCARDAQTQWLAKGLVNESDVKAFSRHIQEQSSIKTR